MSGVVRIPVAAQPAMPWANGGGTTVQVAIEPPGATLAGGFLWRVSRARVASDGPFSRLPGVDRQLWVLRGNGLRLDVDGRDVVLDRQLQRWAFAGEAVVAARLLDGPIEDLNVMTARGRVRADATVLELAAGAVHAVAPAAQRLVVVLAGAVQCAGLPAGELDALRCDGDAEFTLAAAAASRLLVCRFVPA